MSISKIVKSIVDADSKDFESELARLGSDERTDMNLTYIYEALMYKQDLDGMKTYISFLRENDLHIFTSEEYLVESNQWEMLKLLNEANDCVYVHLNNIFDADNTDAIDKVVEYGIMTPLELKIHILSCDSLHSFKMYKKIIQMYPDEISDEMRRSILEQCYLYDTSIECLKEYVDLLDEDSDIRSIVENNFNLERYNILVQKVPKVRIIEKLLNPVFTFDFDPDLIDVIGIIDLRWQLQYKITEFESIITDDPYEYHIKKCCAKLLMHSGLDFKKKYLIECLFDLRNLDFLKVLPTISKDYYTDQEKSDIIMRLQKSTDVTKMNTLFKLGWKIIDTPENREKWKLPISIYDALPKY